MRGLQIAGLVILVVGTVGYALAFLILWRFRRWMGARGAGWPRLLLSTLLALMGLLGGLYAASLLMSLGLVPRPARLAVSFANGIALAVVPWVVVGGLAKWWRPRLGAGKGD